MRNVLKESAIIVLTGTLINYPLSLLFLWFLMSFLGLNSPFWVGTWTTLGLTVVAFIRVVWIRSYYEKRRNKGGV